MASGKPEASVADPDAVTHTIRLKSGANGFSELLDGTETGLVTYPGSEHLWIHHARGGYASADAVPAVEESLPGCERDTIFLLHRPLGGGGGHHRRHQRHRQDF